MSSIKVVRWWWAVGMMLGASATHAEVTAPAVAGSAYSEAQLKQWAHSPEWYALLYYREGLGGVESEADDAAFFLSPAGKSDPLAELEASLQGFADVQLTGDAHAQCRFPARYHWLKQVAPAAFASAPVPACSGFSAFAARMSAKTVTMVYPVPNMDDVSTLFGHSFLRLDRNPAPEVDKSDDYTLNFAALLRKGYDQSDLVTKGLSGELEGIFTVLPYRKKLKEYLRMEARDVWEYRLNFTQAETDQLVRHAWEVRTAYFEYEFFAENCSYRMLNYLDVARPGMGLRDQYSMYVVPMDAVETVIGAGMVDNVHYQPSDQSRWLATADALTEEERAQFREGKLSTERMAPSSAVPRPLQPGEVGHYSGRVRVSGGVREGVTVASVGLRPAYQDFLDAPSGGPLAEITALEINARQIEEQAVELTDFTFFAASSVKARNALYSPWSWRLATGVTGVRWRDVADSPGVVTTAVADKADEADAFLQALDTSEWINPLYARVLLGPAWGGSNVAFYQLIGVEVQTAGEFERGADALALWNPGVVARSEHWQAQLEMLVKEPADALRDTHGMASASLSRRLSVDVAAFVRVLREKDMLGMQNEAQLGAAFYF